MFADMKVNYSFTILYRLLNMLLTVAMVKLLPTVLMNVWGNATLSIYRKKYYENNVLEMTINISNWVIGHIKINFMIMKNLKLSNWNGLFLKVTGGTWFLATACIKKWSRRLSQINEGKSQIRLYRARQVIRCVVFLPFSST
jgi:hypothetical protein